MKSQHRPELKPFLTLFVSGTPAIYYFISQEKSIFICHLLPLEHETMSR